MSLINRLIILSISFKGVSGHNHFSGGIACFISFSAKRNDAVDYANVNFHKNCLNPPVYSLVYSH